MEKGIAQYNILTQKQENKPVVDFLKNILATKKEKISYLEVGAGNGTFPKLLRDELKIKDIDITCLDINPSLAAQLSSIGFKTITASAEKMPFPDGSFDVLHCSHMIEHMSYPLVAHALDEFARVVKKDGYIIIRSPLMHYGFWNNIDHVRPYPPKSILMYFAHVEQQKNSPYKVELVKEWTRREAWGLRLSIPGITWINHFFISLWSISGFPRSKPTGYVAIFQKK